MKKTIKVIVTAIVCLAVLILPMTVMAEEGIDYIISATILTEGENTCTPESGVPYTVFILDPEETGEYTISSDDCLIGIVSYLDMWVQFEPTEDIVNTNVIEWSCGDANQAIMIGVSANVGEFVINVTREELDTSDAIPYIIYENAVKPEKFEMPSFVDVTAFEDGYVDFEDKTVDNAVLGDDGYYHLNDKNGPVLFANLNDSIMSLYTIINYGKLSSVAYENDVAIEITDYTQAFMEYVDALPVNAEGTITSFYYPLTADLIEFFKEVGASNNWYSGDEPWVYDSEDAWMFACYYDADVTDMNSAANNSSNNTSSDNNPADGTDTDTKSPSTGDSVASLSLAMSSVATILFVGRKVK